MRLPRPCRPTPKGPGPELDITVKLDVAAYLFKLEVCVQRHGTRAVFVVDKDQLMTRGVDVRQWVIDRITATVALPDQFHA